MLEEISTSLDKILGDAVNSCKSNCIALSGGLDSSILCHYLQQRSIKGIVIIAKDFLGTDLTYSQLAAKEFGIELLIEHPTIEELFSAIEETIKILMVFNHIEIRNAIVMYLALKKAKQNGFSGIITGDGADELFAGYNFFLKKNNNEIQTELERIWKIMHFSTQKIGQDLGIRVESPYLNEKVVRYAKSIPVDLKVGTKDGKKFGKWILRKMFEDKIPKQLIWRKKSPMQDGAGTTDLTHFFDSLIPTEKYESDLKKFIEKDNVTLQSRESLYYYEIYRKYFKPPTDTSSTESRCPFCQNDIEPGTHFCRMCGSLS